MTAHTVNIGKVSFGSISVLGVEAGTTGQCGGDRSHGCRTVLRLKQNFNSYFRVTVDGNVYDPVREGVEIVFGGDKEHENFIKALQFALKIYNEDLEARKEVFE